MGLFDKLKRKKETPPSPDDSYELRVNLTEKSIKVESPENQEKYGGGLKLIDDGKAIKMLQYDTVLFEVGNRSKAYKEVKPYVPYGVYLVVLARRKGDYGYYYNVRMLFKMARTEGQRIASEIIASSIK